MFLKLTICVVIMFFYYKIIHNNKLHFPEKSPTQWTLNKLGQIGALSISINKISPPGLPEKYLDPLILNNTLSIRICLLFQSIYTVRPFKIQTDIYGSAIIINLTESHILMMIKLLRGKTSSNNNDDKNNTRNHVSVQPSRKI